MSFSEPFVTVSVGRAGRDLTQPENYPSETYPDQTQAFLLIVEVVGVQESHEVLQRLKECRNPAQIL